MNFPDYRPRRMRRTEALRRMIRETRLSVDNLIYPMFVVSGSGVQKAIPSMPGQFNLSVDKATELAARAADLGIPGVILFGIPERKDAVGSEAWSANGVVQKAIRSQSNFNNLAIGAPLASAAVFGPGLALEVAPTCPSGGAYTWLAVVPTVGTPYGDCDYVDPDGVTVHAMAQYTDTSDW